jgi:hypothetical protein
MTRPALLAAVVVGALTLNAQSSHALDADRAELVMRGVQFLRSQMPVQRVGEAAIGGLALVKAELPADDPGIVAALRIVGEAFTSGGIYQPQREPGQDIYEAGCIIMFLANLDAVGYKPQITAVASYIQSQQKNSGGWDYKGRAYGDTSISQYGVLGLWEAENVGVSIAPQVWDRAASFFLNAQDAGGGWNYHRDEPGYPDTISMTSAGVGSLLICQRQLLQYRTKQDTTNPYLVPLIPEGTLVRYSPGTSANAIKQGAERGTRWITANLQIGATQIMGQSPYYGLYGIERVGALADQATLGAVNWFDAGFRYIASSQKGNGSWLAQHGEVPNTSWSILFLVKSTAKSVQRIQVKKLGAGTLVGGRGLPKDLTSMTVAGGRVLARPMNGAVEGMLSVLEDPRAQNADSALAGLVARYQSEGPDLLRPLKDRFQKLQRDPDPGVRAVAAWALARTADLDVVPLLINALSDPDEGVVSEARTGLQLLGRKFDGLGPPPNGTPEQKQAAAKAWRDWFAETRPGGLSDDDSDETATPAKPSGAASP